MKTEKEWQKISLSRMVTTKEIQEDAFNAGRTENRPTFKELFKEARKSPTYVKERLNLLREEMRSDRRFIKAQVTEIARLAAGNSSIEPSVNERCILNICKQIIESL